MILRTRGRNRNYRPTTAFLESDDRLQNEAVSRPRHYGIDCFNFSQVGQKWEIFQVYALYGFFFHLSKFQVRVLLKVKHHLRRLLAHFEHRNSILISNDTK